MVNQGEMRDGVTFYSCMIVSNWVFGEGHVLLFCDRANIFLSMLPTKLTHNHQQKKDNMVKYNTAFTGICICPHAMPFNWNFYSAWSEELRAIYITSRLVFWTAMKL